MRASADAQQTHEREETSTATDVALVAVFAALLAALSLMPPIPVGAAGVPITLQTLAVALAAMVLGPWRGAAAVGLYLVVGLVGLPVFAGGAAGVAVLAKPSAGYLLSFPLAAIIIGLLSRRALRSRHRSWRYALLVLSGLAGSFLVVHPLGIVGMVANADLSWTAAALADMLYWPGDVIKNLAAGAIAASVHAAFPRLLPRHASRRAAAGA
ncbi:biotin transporter BioY [Parenemella sanctibonifatiensis]|nr:biotin transporter BioY [Parenemella sanctibonifatiensis]